MVGKGQSQNISDNSHANQAGRDINITNVGLSYSEVKEVALDVFRANFLTLSHIAGETAKKRAEEITERFLERLQAENPNGLEKAQTPGFQYSLFSVQKEYAKTGDLELGDLLVDLLVDSSKQEERNILQIVLNESINIAPKLTREQLATLAVTFLFKYTVSYGVISHASLGEYLDLHILPFVNNLVKNAACYQHLEFSGCGKVSAFGKSLESILSEVYQGLFMEGIDVKELEEFDVSDWVKSNLFTICLNSPHKLQIKTASKEVLHKVCEEESVPEDAKEKLIKIFDSNKMSESKVRDKCIEIRGYMSSVFEVWTESSMKNFTLTSVGIAIGHANVKRLVNEFADLSIWIN